MGEAKRRKLTGDISNVTPKRKKHMPRRRKINGMEAMMLGMLMATSGYPSLPKRKGG